jgi:hypothetical protein
MATIINFNFLNFFRLKNERYHINSLNLNIQKFHDHYNNEDTIDITDYKVIQEETYPPTPYTLPSEKKRTPSGWTYDRRGRSVRYTSPPKGLYIDDFA